MSKQTSKSQKDAKEHHCGVSERVAKMDRQFLADMESMIRENHKEALRLIRMMLEALKDPFKGIGKPEPLKHERCWSRRLNLNDRVEYSVENDCINFFKALGHYTRN